MHCDLLLALAIVPHIQPDFFTSILQEFMPQGGEFPEFGGVKGKNHRGVIPTGETAQFILAGSDPEARIAVAAMLAESAPLVKEGILYLEAVPEGEPQMSGRLLMTQDYVDYFLTGERSKPRFSPEFPAREIFTELEWTDLVLTEEVREQIEELRIWIAHNDILMQQWQMAKKIKPGYRALFHGPSGTGKTLTATLLGKYTKKPVYRVDLSTVVSKYIGETEKNLERLFQKARNRDWILFFDEADAIFGKRTGVKDAHDRYANQEVSYLLQRVEDFEGLVILSSNFKSNIDEAFLRRFNAIIKFPFPNKYERQLIAHKAFPENIRFEKRSDIPALISDYELSGGNIINVVQYACLKSISKRSDEIFKEDVLKGIRREVEKEGKVFSVYA
ncbi:ATP-binding protein [Poritiphilus flavus]|uniref:AAA family ATPase n=1 Tax=Poritiphilus flavus TaxID=2697053 RepID=A0A6L9EI20_9FLAO|nr:ATP-binding protein [Poritiphilus flavus]NAS14295.1 AAA family ATPase [Poritiphilus flavus]